MKKPRTQQGVTLVELMVTVTVLLILAAMAGPSFVDYLARSQVRNAADALSTQFASARAEAMRHDRNVSVKVKERSGSDDWCAGAKGLVPAAGVSGLVPTSGVAASCECDSANAVTECVVAGNSSLVDSNDFRDVDLVQGDGVALQFDRKLGTLDFATMPAEAGRTFSVRSSRRPTRYQLDVIVSPLGNSRVCVPAGYVSFGGYRPCS